MTANIVNRVYKHSAINSQGNECIVENRNCLKKKSRSLINDNDTETTCQAVEIFRILLSTLNRNVDKYSHV